MKRLQRKQSRKATRNVSSAEHKARMRADAARKDEQRRAK